MTLRLNKDGYLPKGIHKATLNEIKQRFGSSSSKRKELFKGFQSLVQLLRKHKGDIKEFLLNGSFVTNKELPKDFDFNSPEVKQLRRSKELFNGHILTAIEEDTIECHRLIDFFGHDRDRKPKGLVGVIL